jgi:hypothetical protein
LKEGYLGELGEVLVKIKKSHQSFLPNPIRHRGRQVDENKLNEESSCFMGETGAEPIKSGTYKKKE